MESERVPTRAAERRLKFSPIRRLKNRIVSAEGPDHAEPFDFKALAAAFTQPDGPRSKPSPLWTVSAAISRSAESTFSRS